VGRGVTARIVSAIDRAVERTLENRFPPV